MGGAELVDVQAEERREVCRVLAMLAVVTAGFATEACLAVAESARACSYYSRKQVQKQLHFGC